MYYLHHLIYCNYAPNYCIEWCVLCTNKNYVQRRPTHQMLNHAMWGVHLINFDFAQLCHKSVRRLVLQLQKQGCNSVLMRCCSVATRMQNMQNIELLQTNLFLAWYDPSLTGKRISLITRHCSGLIIYNCSKNDIVNKVMFNSSIPHFDLDNFLLGFL